MKNVLLVYAPFCTPASPPFSITNIQAFLKDNLNDDFSVDVLDLNIKFHKQKFSKYHDYFKNIKSKFNKEGYDSIVGEYTSVSGKIYSQNNKAVVNGDKPELFEEMLDLILKQKPTIVGFSIVFSSQAFYAYALISELESRGIKCVIGGPAVNDKLKAISSAYHNNVIEFTGYLQDKEYKTKEEYDSLNYETIMDFSIYDLEDYFVPESVIPIRASSSCYFRQCAFCTHYKDSSYMEFSLENVENIIKKSGAKNIFFVDDMIHKNRLLDIAKILKPLNVKWLTQLRPTADLDKETLQTLEESGLSVVLWGVESGNDRVLNMMRKGTNKKDIAELLSNSKSVGIRNVVYTMFGFPTETEEELEETVNFLKENSENIDLISTSIFGLQYGSYVFDHPEEYGVVNITETPRTILEPKISYETTSGLKPSEINKLRKKHQKTIDGINKYPKNMNFFREHMLALD